MSKHHHQHHEAALETEAHVDELPATEVTEVTEGTESGEATEAAAPGLGIADLGKKMGLAPRRVRQLLRKAEIERTGRLYSWETEADLDEVIAKIEASKAKPEASAEEGAEDGAEPKASKRSRKKKNKEAAVEADPALQELENLDEIEEA